MASVKKAWIKKYGEQEGLRRWEEQKKKYGKTKEQLRQQYGDSYVEELSKKKSVYSLDACIEKYGETLGPLKWKERLNKKILTQQKRKESGHHYKNGRTLEEYQYRYGIEDGYNKWKKRNDRQSYTSSKQRYIDDFGHDLGVQRIHEIKDNSSLKSFMKRYGSEVGKLRYEENCKKCAITESKMIEKYGLELGMVRYKQWVLKVTQTKNTLFNKGYSKISQELFWQIYNSVSQKLKDNCYFAELNEEFQFFINDKSTYPKKIIMPDFKCGNVIIEFDGSYWHKDSKDIDLKRDSILESKGYSVLRISDTEYTEDKNKCITKCIKFINERA